MQVNYTGICQSNRHQQTTPIWLTSADSPPVAWAQACAGNEAVGGVVIDSHRLEGVSTNTFNLVGLYEKGPIGLRLGYNWRSKGLTSNIDCCIGLPVFQKAAGFMDGSICYSIDSHVELSFDVVNLLDTKIQYQQEVFGDSSATPGAKPVYMDSGWSATDRRYQLGVRAKF